MLPLRLTQINPFSRGSALESPVPETHQAGLSQAERAELDQCDYDASPGATIPLGDPHRRWFWEKNPEVMPDPVVDERVHETD